MTKLDCSVTGCLYNEEKCCCKGEIMVEGRSAKEAKDTCCGSFREKSGSANKAFENPTKETGVKCEATTCKFNDSCCCSADHIGIAGGNACNCQETECASFCCK